MSRLDGSRPDTSRPRPRGSGPYGDALDVVTSTGRHMNFGMFVQACSSQATKFVQHRGGSIAIAFSLVAPIMLLAVGATIDYAGVVSGKRSLQAVADAAAIAGARATRLGNATKISVASTVAHVVAANSRGASITNSTSVAADLTSVTMTVSQEIPTRFRAIVGASSTQASA